MHRSSPIVYFSSSMGFLKLNFDRASKGNSGPYDFGGVFRDAQGSIIRFYVGDVGIERNNAIEIFSLSNCRQTASWQGFSRLGIEGDSQIIINMVVKIQNGSPIQKNTLTREWKVD